MSFAPPKNIRLRDLPVKTIYRESLYGLFPVEGYIVESVYDPRTGKLDVIDVLDVTESEVGKLYLALPECQVELPRESAIHRVYLGYAPRDESVPVMWLLLQYDGIWTVLPVFRTEVSRMEAKLQPLTT